MLASPLSDQWCHCFVDSLSPNTEMCSERDSPLEPFVLPAPGQPELARLICGAHLSPPVLTRKQKRPRVNSLVCDRAAAFCAAGPPEALFGMSRLVTQAAKRERELARARSHAKHKDIYGLTLSQVNPKPQRGIHNFNITDKMILIYWNDQNLHMWNVFHQHLKISKLAVRYWGGFKPC